LEGDESSRLEAGCPHLANRGSAHGDSRSPSPPAPAPIRQSGNISNFALAINDYDRNPVIRLQL